MLQLFSLFFFSMASAGFVIFTIRYPRGSEVRLWGTRASYVFGFVGVIFLRLSRGHFSEAALLIISALVVSLVAFEVASRYLQQE